MSKGCRYDEAGPWNGGANCADGMRPGTVALGDAVVSFWPAYYQGFNCRQNTADADELSMHGTGRGLDIFPRTVAIGDQIAAYLVEHHAELGVQYVIWYRRAWTCARGWHDYTGPVPHTDHLHVEQDALAAETIFADYHLPGEFTVLDRATRNYLEKNQAAIRGAQARAARRQLKFEINDKVRHKELLAAIRGVDLDVNEVDEDLDRLRARVASLDTFIRDELGEDPEDDDAEFRALTAPLEENPGTESVGDVPTEG